MSYDDVRKQLMQATYKKNTGSQATQAKSAASTPAPARSSGYDDVYAQLESSLGSDARLRDARNRAGQASGVQTPAATTSSYDEKTNTLYYEGPLAEQYVKMYSDNYRAIQPVWEQREKEQMYSAFGVDNDEDLKAALDEYYLNRPEELVTLLAEALKMLWSVDISDCPKTFDLSAELADKYLG